MKKSLIAFILTLFIGYETPILAQAIIYQPDANWSACWDQNASSLAEINNWRFRMTLNTNNPIVIAPSCTGISSPFVCNSNTKIPLAMQTGQVRVIIEAASLQSDGSLSPYSVLVNDIVTFATPIPAPTPGSGSNLRLVKLLEQLVSYFHFGTW